MDLESAVEVFVKGFSRAKSLVHPYVASQVDGIWVMQDGPGRKTARKIEVVSCQRDPAETVAAIKRQRLGWHFVCAIHPLDADLTAIKEAHKALGYRSMATEKMFVHDLAEIPVLASEPLVRQVSSKTELGHVNQVNKHARKLQEGTRLYGIWDDVRDYGWVESIPVSNNAWVAGLYVYEEFRGRGYGGALMSRLLLDDRANGVNTSVLLASTAGARLYPHLGYRHIGTLQLFCPTKRG